MGECDEDGIGSGETISVNISSSRPPGQWYTDLWIPLKVTTCSAEIRAGHLSLFQRKHFQGKFKSDVNRGSRDQVWVLNKQISTHHGDLHVGAHMSSQVNAIPPVLKQCLLWIWGNGRQPFPRAALPHLQPTNEAPFKQTFYQSLISGEFHPAGGWFLSLGKELSDIQSSDYFKSISSWLKH